jgi:hypothetical protein
MGDRFARRRIDDEEIWLDLQEGQFFGINGSGTAILAAWREGVREPAAIAERLVASFEVGRDEALAAVTAFLEEARARGLLEE